jgi:hypothetical protein
MKHQSNRELFKHWNEQRGVRLAPDRADIDPAAIRTALGDTFLLNETLQFRLGGTRLCALLGRELRAESFSSLWRPTDQPTIRELSFGVMEEQVGIVVGLTGRASDDVLAIVQLEMLLLPLAARSRGEPRVIGALAPMATPYWLGFKAISPLTLGTTRHLGAENAVPLFKAVGGRIKHGLTVYDGGRAG